MLPAGGARQGAGNNHRGVIDRLVGDLVIARIHKEFGERSAMVIESAFLSRGNGLTKP